MGLQPDVEQKSPDRAGESSGVADRLARDGRVFLLSLSGGLHGSSARGVRPSRPARRSTHRLGPGFPNGPLAARLWLLAAALLFSTGGAAIKASALDAWQVTGLRSGIAGLVILLLLPGARRRPGAAGVLAGLAYATTMVLFVRANTLTTAASTIFLQSTAPLWVILFGPSLLGERVTRRDIAVLAAVTIGLLLVFASPETTQKSAPDPFSGNAFALLAGVFWAVTIGSLRFLERRAPGTSAAGLALGNPVCFLVCLPFALPLPGLPVRELVIVLWLGVFQVGLAYVCLVRGLQKVPAIEATLLLLVEAALNPIWVWLVHGEVPGALTVLGGALILGATTVKAIAGTESARKASPEPPAIDR